MAKSLGGNLSFQERVEERWKERVVANAGGGEGESGAMDNETEAWQGRGGLV